MPSYIPIKGRILGAFRLSRALRLVWKSAPKLALVRTGLLLVKATLPLAALWLTKNTIDAVAAGMSSSDKEQAFVEISFWIGAAGVVALVGAASSALASVTGEIQGLAVAERVQDIIHAKSTQVDLEYYESAQYFDTLHRAQQQSSSRPLHVVNAIESLGQNSISLALMAVLLLSFHWIMALALFVATLPGVAARIKYSRSMYRQHTLCAASERKAKYFDWLLTGQPSAKELRLFGLGDLFIERFREIRQRLHHERINIQVRYSGLDLLAQSCALCTVYCSYAFIAFYAMCGTISLGALVMYFQAFQRGQSFLKNSLASLAELYEANLFLAHLDEFLQVVPRIAAPRKTCTLPYPMRKGIVFDKVSFRYPQSTRFVLEDVSIELAVGKVTALVGENGAGKSTLVKLLCRLYDPIDGTISADGVNLRSFAPDNWRQQIGAVFQDCVQYQMTVRENIWLGDVTISSKDEKIKLAAKHADIEEKVLRLTKGYDTFLGKWLEQGEELSLGEWQKLALARAFLRDAPIIILDEPSSSMDARAEYQIFRKFRQLAQGRTTLLISHRFSTVKIADYIYVLEGGRIAEHGSHEQLLERKGTYSRLFTMQASGYWR